MRPRGGSYAKVEQLSKHEDNHKTKAQRRTDKAEYYSTKIHAFLWIVAAAALIYFLDIFHIIGSDPRVSRTYLNVGLVSLGINTCITFYLAIWLPYIQKNTLEWSVYCPRMIPIATAVGVLGTFCFVVGLWPIWGLLTPAILFILFVASLMTAHFLPSI